jgi:predicted transcriptional regulator
MSVEKHYISVHLENDAIERIDALAEADDRSRHGMIRALIKRGLAATEAEAKGKEKT